MHVAVGFAERPLGFDPLGVQETFDDDLRVRRHHDVMGLALDRRDRLPRQAAGHTQFVDTVWNLLHRHVRYNRRRTDHQRGWKMCSLRLRFLPVEIDVLAQAGWEHADAAARFDLAAIVTDVLYARFRVRGNPVRASRVRAVVEARRGDRHGKLVQAETFLVERVTDVDDLLASLTFSKSHALRSSCVRPRYCQRTSG